MLCFVLLRSNAQGGKRQFWTFSHCLHFSAFYGIHNFYLPLKMMRERERERGSRKYTLQVQQSKVFFISHLFIFKRHLIIKASVLFNVSLLTGYSSIERVKVYYTDCVVCLFFFFLKGFCFQKQSCKKSKKSQPIPVFNISCSLHTSNHYKY